MNVASIGGSQSSHDRHGCRSAESAHIYDINANSLVFVVALSLQLMAA
jgi:hypothetical protein